MTTLNKAKAITAANAAAAAASPRADSPGGYVAANADKGRREGFRTYTSPQGTLLWSRLQTPESFKGGAPRYSTSLVVEVGAAADEFERMILGFLEEAKQEFGVEKLESPPMKRSENEELVVKFSVPALSKTRKGTMWDRKPVIFEDSPPIAVTRDLSMGNGTTAKVAFQVYSWEMRGGAGVSLQPVAVHVLDLVEYRGREDQDFGFGGDPELFIGEIPF